MMATRRQKLRTPGTCLNRQLPGGVRHQRGLKFGFIDFVTPRFQQPLAEESNQSSLGTSPQMVAPSAIFCARTPVPKERGAIFFSL